MASTSDTTLCSLMSMCSTTSRRRSDFFGFIIQGGASFQFANQSRNASWKLAPLLRVQPFHIIFHAFLQRESRLVTKLPAHFVQVGLRKVLIMRVGIVDVIGRQIQRQRLV